MVRPLLFQEKQLRLYLMQNKTKPIIIYLPTKELHMNINNFKIPANISDWSEARQSQKPKYQNPKTKKINKVKQKLFDNSQRLEGLYREYMDKYETTILDLMSQMHQATLDQDLELFKTLADKAKNYLWHETNDYFDRLARYIQPRIKSLAIDAPYRNTLNILKTII